MNNPKFKIQLANSKICTGCTACKAVCPMNCISMQEDKEGFIQPHIDEKTCIKCHKCEKTCPILKDSRENNQELTYAYAVINNNEEIRRESSSGGVFYEIAEYVINEGGVVFGARWNEKWDVVHDYTETIDGIKPFMQSKYVQSYIGETFRKAKEFLDANRLVLFSGTPCQLGGLRALLGKPYNNLIQVDLVCHGVPSPGVWRKYLNSKFSNEHIVSISFRDKQDGWMGFQCVTTTTTTTAYRDEQKVNPYFRGFVNNVYLRKSCYNCHYKQFNRDTDITLADYWGVHLFAPDMHDNKGTSLILVHNKKSAELLDKITSKFTIKVQSKENAVAWNHAMISSVPLIPKRKYFFKNFHKSWEELIEYIDKDRIHVRILRKLKKILSDIIP